MYGNSRARGVEKMMRIVVYDPHRFLRVIKHHKSNDEQFREWLSKAPPVDSREKEQQYILGQALSALSLNTLNEEGSQFVSLIEKAIKKIQESAEETYGFFSSVQKQINHHKDVLGETSYDPFKFIRGLEKHSDLADRFSELENADEAFNANLVLHFVKITLNYVEHAEEYQNERFNRSRVISNLAFHASSFLGIINSVNYRSADHQ